MNMKKVLLGTATTAAVFLLTACGSNPKDEFIKTMYDSQNTSEYNAGEMSLKVKDFTYESDDKNAYASMIASQLKDVSIEGNYLTDSKKGTSETNFTFKVLGQKIPFNVVSDKDNFYLSTNFISGILDLADSFGANLPVNQAELKKLEGKYVNVLEAGEQIADKAADTTDSSNPFKNISPEDTNIPTEKLNAAIKKTIETFDKDSFKKDKDTLTHTFTKAEMVKLLESTDKTLKADKDYKKEYSDSGMDKQMASMIEFFKEKTSIFKTKIAINEKTKKMVSEVNVGTENEDNKDEKMSITLNLTTTPKKDKTAVKLPAKKEILTSKEFEDILNSLVESATTSDSSSLDSLYGDDTDLSDDKLVSDLLDEKLDELITMINENKAGLTVESANEIREQGKQIFNDEQMKRLEEALDKALQGKA